MLFAVGWNASNNHTMMRMMKARWSIEGSQTRKRLQTHKKCHIPPMKNVRYTCHSVGMHAAMRCVMVTV
jgi:urease accessory protein UreH